ncbi:MAG: amino acid ABC transporter permease [Thermostichales cyanobacterium DRC_bins_46]
MAIAEPTLRPPQAAFDWQRWLRKNFFDSWWTTALTILSVLVAIWAVRLFWHWAFGAANWAVIPNNLKVLMSGTYPIDQLWRVWLTMGLVLAALGVAGGAWGGVLRQYVIGLASLCAILALIPLGSQSQLFLAGIAATTAGSLAVGWQRRSWQLPTIVVWVLLLPVCLVILLGGAGLPSVRVEQLSGLLLTLLLAAIALIVAFPIGVLLALGRTNTELPVIKIFCTLLIELIRGVPLTTILFAAWLLVPLFLEGMTVNLLVRAEVGFILFTAVYVAEDVRGGLQSVSRGQIEAARALGLNPFQITALVVLPQALRVAVPALVNAFLTLFKDTSLVFIIGMIDLLAAGRIAYTNPQWLGTQKEVLFFVGVIYFICCFAMAYAAKAVEKSLGLGKR